MRKSVLAASTVRAGFLGCAGALALIGIGSSAALAQPGGGYCPQVKNSAARDICGTARTQFYKGNYVVALDLTRKALAMSPKEGILRVMVAQIQWRRGGLPQAEQELRQARTDGAPDHAVLPVLFPVMVARHREAILLNEFAEPPANAKGDVAADILRGRAVALQSLGRYPEAVAAMDRSLALRRDAVALIVRANIATKLNDTELAGKLVDEAFRLAPDDLVVMAAKLKRLEQLNDMAGALALSDRFLKVFPVSSEARESRIRVFLKQNQDAKAAAEVNALVARRSNSPLAAYYKAVLMARAHDKRGAAQTIQSLPPEFVKARPDLALQMAQILLDNGNIDSATGILGAALGADPNLLDVRLQLVAVKISQNSPQSAMLLLTPVQDSTDPRVKKLLTQARARIAKNREF